MIPGEYQICEGNIELNIGRSRILLTVTNYGDRPIQVGSHFHFFEVNVFLRFNRSITYGYRLDIPSGTTVRFEPGQSRVVQLVSYAGKREVYGFSKNFIGKLDG